MKLQITLLSIFVALSSFRAGAQNSCKPPIYYFDSMSVVSGSGGVNSAYLFSSVLTGIDAIVTITKAQNAQISNANMDNSNGYSVAWQPFITFPSNRSNTSDSSYMEFNVRFVSSGTTTSLQQNCMAMGIVDLDGTGSGSAFREMIKVSLPGTPTAMGNSSISVYQDSKWVLFKSGASQFSNIDTINSAAMGQMNFPSGISSFTMRVGIVGSVSGGTQRQFSLYFKSFAALTVPLPVHLSDFKAVQKDALVNIGWISSYESNFSHFELHRSYDGLTFEKIQTIAGSGSYSSLNHYKLVDEVPAASAQIFYKLKMTDLDAKEVWSHTVVTANAEQIGNGASFRLYPNPVSGQLSINSGALLSISQVRIFDAYGKMVLEQSYGANSETFLLDVSGFPAGVYTVHITDALGLSEEERFVKY